MRNLKSTAIIILLISGIFCMGEKSLSEDNTITSSGITLVASTPGDSLIKVMLQIEQNVEIDFIRWTLSLDTTKSDTNSFTLNITYGLSQPNTTGFTAGGRSKTLAGKYVIKKNYQSINAEVYQFYYDDFITPSFSLVKLNETVFNVLTPANKLMQGNSGWSYTLNRKNPGRNLSPEIFSTANNPFRIEDKGEYVVFAGRTPCGEISRDYGFTVNEECFKLKWKLTFYRDKNTLAPIKYTLRRTGYRATDLEGIWDIISLGKNNSKITLYRLDPDKPDKSIMLFAGDDNVLFFLDKKQNIYVGNKDFSYTLNRDSR